MKKLNLNTKYLKTGGYSVLVSVIAIAIIIVINLFVNSLPATWTQFDLSAGDMLSISEESEKIVSGIETDVKVYYIAQHGNEDSYVTTMLDKYKTMSKKLTVEQIDPALNPNFLTGDRLNVTEGSLIVESEKRSKVISSFEIYYPGYSEENPPQEPFDLTVTRTTRTETYKNCRFTAIKREAGPTGLRQIRMRMASISSSTTKMCGKFLLR